jgi:hypothetical protein
MMQMMVIVMRNEPKKKRVRRKSIRKEALFFLVNFVMELAKLAIIHRGQFSQIWLQAKI